MFKMLLVYNNNMCSIHLTPVLLILITDKKLFHICLRTLRPRILIPDRITNINNIEHKIFIKTFYLSGPGKESTAHYYCHHSAASALPMQLSLNNHTIIRNQSAVPARIYAVQLKQPHHHCHHNAVSAHTYTIQPKQPYHHCHHNAVSAHTYTIQPKQPHHYCHHNAVSAHTYAVQLKQPHHHCHHNAVSARTYAVQLKQP